MQANKDASKQIYTYMLPGHCGEDFQDRLVKKREVVFARDSREYIACMVLTLDFGRLWKMTGGSACGKKDIRQTKRAVG